MIIESPELSFASQGQYLLINEASISWLADRIPEGSECERSSILHRFRGNIIVTGCAAFEETTWKSIRIGMCDFEVNLRILFNFEYQSYGEIVMRHCFRSRGNVQDVK